MMFGSQFYHQSLRKYIVAFGNMFNDITIQRLNSSDAVVQTIAVPIAYGPKRKWIVRITQNKDLDAQVGIQLPRIGFEITGMQYDSTRRLSGTTKNVAFRGADVNTLHTQYVPVPWDVAISLHAFVKNSDDGAQIVEQILPFFDPSWTNAVNVIPTMGNAGRIDVPTILVGVSIDDSYEGPVGDRQVLVYTFDFIMKCVFFGPIRRQGIIKRVQVDNHVVTAVSNTSGDAVRGFMFGGFTNDEIVNARINSRVRVTPGLLANGVGTANSAASIPYATVSANSAWKYATNTFFYVDGRHRDPTTGQDYVP